MSNNCSDVAGRFFADFLLNFNPECQIAKVGSCVDASLCHVVSNGLCTTLKADVDIALHAAAGLLGNVKASVDGKVDVKLGLWA